MLSNQIRFPTIGLLAFFSAGSVCESADFQARDRELPPMNPGDLFCVMGAGAYGSSMSSAYNSRPRAAEVLVDGSAWSVIRDRPTHDSLWEGERIPDRPA